MTSAGTTDGPTGPVAAALAAWSAEPRLAPALRGGGAYLVLSADGADVLHASEAARGAAAAIAGSFGLAGQLAGAPSREGSVSLVRLRLDPRRISVPSTCLLARGRLGDGTPALLLVFDKTLPARLRAPVPHAATPASSEPTPAPAEVAPERPPEAAPETPGPTVEAGARFVWRSDAEGRLGAASGGSDTALRALLDGQTWEGLASSGTLRDGAPLLAALAAQRTFRAVPVGLALSASGRDVALDLSGAPLARAGRPFSGYAGFGVVRAVTAADAPEAVPAGPDSSAGPQATLPAWRRPEVSLSADPLLASAMADAEPAAEDGAALLSSETAPEAAPLTESHPEELRSSLEGEDQKPQRSLETSFEAADAAPQDEVDSGDETARPASSEVGPTDETDRPAARDEAGTAPAADVETLPSAASEAPAQEHAAEEHAHAAGASEDATAPLSVNEHAAFREIAKALGARFAGDEEEPAEARPESVAGFRPASGSVTPFPSRVPEAPQADAAALLDGVPAALLVCRGDALIHANRCLLDLADFADLAALQAEGGLARLFHGLPPQGSGAAVIATREGGSRETMIEQARIVWLGEPADCLCLQPLPEADPARASAAASVADRFVRERASEAEAGLDAVEDAVLGLDGAGRVLSLNRAAASLFACEPREVVGGAFADLFPPASIGTVRALLQAPSAGARELAVRSDAPARRLSLTPARPDGRRVAVLREPAPVPAPPSARAGDTAEFAARVAREIRTPVTGITDSAERILAEPFGPLGDERYRGSVSDIRASGEQVLAIVDDLVDLSQIESGRHALAFAPLALNDLVAECVSELQAQAAGGRVLLRTSFAADLAPVLADERSLRQAAMSAIAGAIRETAAGGQVIVSTTQAERGEIALRVRDTGAGPSAPEAEPAPAPSLARKAGLPGLGLPLTRALVEANHGRFRVSSRKDEGTLVEMLFSAEGTARRA